MHIQSVDSRSLDRRIHIFSMNLPPRDLIEIVSHNFLCFLRVLINGVLKGLRYHKVKLGKGPGAPSSLPVTPVT